MAAWTATDVKATLPEFAAIADTVINVYIAIAARQINDVEFPDRIVEAGVFLTGHLMKVLGVLGGSSGATGAIASVTVGQVSVSYAQARAAMSDATLSTTTYGAEFLALCHGAGLGVMVI